ncbi:MAG: hypothetical protein P3B98_03560 [Gemmatimonadota bacterium]|nr:hypothetical protein [Gemmatimonadota bacterium]
MATIRFDRGRRGLRFSASSPRGVALLVLAYLVIWGLSGQRLTRAEAETAVRTYLTFALTRAQTGEGAVAAAGIDSATAERWIAEREALDAARIGALDIRHSLLDYPLSTEADFTVRVRFASGVQPSERYFRVRKHPVTAPAVRRVSGVWEWRLHL